MHLQLAIYYVIYPIIALFGLTFLTGSELGSRPFFFYWLHVWLGVDVVDAKIQTYYKWTDHKWSYL